MSALKNAEGSSVCPIKRHKKSHVCARAAAAGSSAASHFKHAIAGAEEPTGATRNTMESYSSEQKEDLFSGVQGTCAHLQNIPDLEITH